MPHLLDFFRGLVFATMSDKNGLVEGMDESTLDYYVSSHPILESTTVLERIEDPRPEGQEADAKAEPQAWFGRHARSHVYPFSGGMKP